ncbi:cohesin subunit SA-3 [Pogoniulus pusillus]|uniref:cohesin subunit SA-3 n=1 Tax=Pogoniulus pusillus TaxID=488313 RepID=UPI0030B98376
MASRRRTRSRGAASSSGSSGATGTGSSSGPSSRPSPSPPAPSSLDLSSDSGSDFEATLRPSAKRRRRQPPAHVPKRPRQEHSSPVPIDSDSSTLYQAVLSATADLETLADEWLETYQGNQEKGFLELANFLVRSCGCRGVVTPKMLQELQSSELIQQLTQDFAEVMPGWGWLAAGTRLPLGPCAYLVLPTQESPEYPLSMGTQPWRRFRVGFCGLLAAVVRRCRSSAIFDGFLMPTLVALLTCLADSQVRAFRHTSTLAAVKLLTELGEVALGIGLQRDGDRRHLEAELGKEPGHRAAGRVEALLERSQELQEQQQEVEDLMNAIFKGVFVHRYRDVVPQIRAICMEELGIWMRSFSASFLTDGHLKYLGWTLHDKQGEVRLQVVKALQGLYGHPGTAAHLELFTSRFKGRLLAMVLDKEPEVALEVVKLLTMMLDTMEDALLEVDCCQVYPLVYAASRPLASAAGLFLYRRLLASAGDTQSFLRLLLDFFLESQLHEHAAYLVDSLWDCAGARLRDWEGISSLLLQAAPPEGLAPPQEQALVQVLAASVAQAAQGHPPVGREPLKKPSAQLRRAQAEERTRLSLCLVPVLPQLLAKFSADAETATAVLELVPSLELASCRSRRLERHLQLLLGQLQEVVQKHSGKGVLGAASRALHALCAPELPTRPHADLALGILADQLAERCQAGIAELLQAASLDEEELYSLAAVLRRTSALFSAHDLTPWQIFEPCAKLLQYAADTGEVPGQVLVPTISCLHFHLLWELSRLPSANVPKEQLQSLRSKAGTFCSLCQGCLADPDSSVQEQAFMVLSDLLLVLGPRLAQGDREELQPLVLVPEAGLHAQMAAFLVDHIFNHGHHHGHEEAVPPDGTGGALQELHQRRLLLAGFCKLLLQEVLELGAATDLFKHYAKFYSDYGDILRETLGSARRRDRQGWGRTLLLSLQQALSELLLQQGPGVAAGEGFSELLLLARRFSALLSQDRAALLALLREGIRFALQDPPGPGQPPLNLPFLEVLKELSARLRRTERGEILAYLEQQCQEWGALPSWPPLASYRRWLQGEEGAPSSRPPPRRRRPDDSSPWPSTPPASPALTSTALRGGPQPRPALSWDSLSSSQLRRRSEAQRLSLMEEEEEEEVQEESSLEPLQEPSELGRAALGSQDRLQDLFDSSILGIEDA